MHRRIGAYSKGMRQRLGLAQVLLGRPKLALLDEPTSALDLHHQLSIMTSIRQEMDRKQPIVIAALHDLNLAAKFCDRLVLLRAGQVLADGTPEAILALPQIGETYRVQTDLERTKRGVLYVDARLTA
jgi:iron complex transport system ATP-binding protein